MVDIYRDAETGEIIPPEQFDPNQYEVVTSPTTYRDADTGETIPEGQFNPDEFEVVYDSSQPEAGPLETAGRTALGGFYGIGRAAAGLGRETQDILSEAETQFPWLYKNVARYIPGIAQVAALNEYDPNFMRDTQDMAQGLIDEQRQELNVRPDSISAGVYDIGSQILPDIAAVGAGAATGAGVLPIAGVTGLRALGDKYGFLRDQGASLGEASAGSAASGALTAGLNAIPIERAIAPGASILNRTLTSGALNVPLGAAGAAGDVAINDAFSSQEPTLEDYYSAAEQGALFGGIAGAGFGLAGSLGSRIKGRTPTELPELAALIDQEAAATPQGGDIPGEQLALPAPEGKIYGDDFIAQDSELVTSDQLAAAQQAARTAEIQQEVEVKRRVENLAKIEPEKSFPEPIQKVESRARSEVENAQAQAIKQEAQSDVANIQSKRTAQALADETIANAPQKSEKIDVTSSDKSFATPIEKQVSPPVETPKIDTSGDIKAALRDRAMSERGSTPIVSDIADYIRERFVSDPDYKGLPDSEQKLQGARGVWGKVFDNPADVARRAGESGKKAFNAMFDATKQISANLSDFRQSIDPYLKLPDRTRVDSFLREMRRYARRQITDTYEARAEIERLKKQNLPVPEQLSVRASKRPTEFSDEQIIKLTSGKEFGGKPFTPEELSAYRAVRNTMNLALDRVEEALIAKADNAPELSREEYTAAVKDWVSLLRDGQYVPFSRFGDFYVVAKDAEGNVVDRRHFEKKSEAKKVKTALEAQYGKGNVEYGHVPLKISSDLGGFNPSLDPTFDPKTFTKQVKAGNRGFIRHLAKAALTEGEEQDLSRSIADYLAGLSRFHGIQTRQPQINAALTALEGEGKGLSAKELKNIWEGWKAPSNRAVGAVNQLVHAWYLAATPAAAIANATQVPIRILPSVTRAVGKDSGRIIAKATGQTFKALKAMARGAAPFGDNKELQSAFAEFTRRGGLGNDPRQEFARLRKGIEGPDVVEKAMYGMFNYVEKVNATMGFLSGFEIAKSKGLSGREAFNFAEAFNAENNIIQNDLGRPALLRSNFGKLTQQYKNYQIQLLKTWMSDIGKSFKGDTRALAALAFSTASYGILGGVSAVLGGTALRVLSAAGINVPTLIEEKAGEAGKFLTYGPLSGLVNLSSGVSTQELVPNIYNDPKMAIANAVVGAGGQFFLNQVPKAYNIANEWDNPRVALETLAPRLPRNISRLERWASEGKMRDFKGEPIIDRPPTSREALNLMLGFAPLDMTREYQKRAARKEATQGGEGVDNLNFKIAKAQMEGDDAKLEKLLDEASKSGQRPSKTAIRNFQRSMESKEGATEVARKRVAKRNRDLFDEIEQIYRD